MTIQEMDDAALDHLARSVAKALSENRQPRTNWDRRLTIIIGALSIVSIIFSVGVNWSRMASVERDTQTVTARVDKLESDMKSDRSEKNTQAMAIQKDLGDIKQQLGEIRGSLSRR